MYSRRSAPGQQEPVQSTENRLTYLTKLIGIGACSFVLSAAGTAGLNLWGVRDVGASSLTLNI